jgi:hypothetical protein
MQYGMQPMLDFVLYEMLLSSLFYQAGLHKSLQAYKPLESHW